MLFRSFPSSPVNGQLAVINNITYAYNSSTGSWTRQQHFFNSTGSVPPTTNLLVGDTWYNTSDDTLYRYTYDGTSYYWVDIITPTVTSNGIFGIQYTANTSPPASGNTVGAQWYNTSTNVLYEYEFDGTNYYWVDISSPTVSSGSTITNVATLLVTSNLGFSKIGRAHV